ncbi:hypothetical protein NA57DRAFT_72475 [Rhizodiscina lignyota]|uniref:Uncharacterized protein n=1 Tax=Rhizodiscina lignyota TaxID=1504668 RepID=A0A9P4ISL6_9PEZI|nr:hypothetical protein NA57DRAFT_72475 [Rhizodiscina lignyota]
MGSDLKDPEATVYELHSLSSEIDPNDAKQDVNIEWTPGFWAQFPKIGLGALLVALIACVGEVIILVTSDGKSQSKWPHRVAPNVLLSISNSVANICFSIAIGNGVAIAWWRQTLKPTTIEQLQRSWAFSTSLKQIAFAGKYFNVIALAALTTKLLIIDAVLMQKATSTYLDTDPPVPIALKGFANATFPRTGGGSGTLSTSLILDLQMWYQRGGFYYNGDWFSGCNSTKDDGSDYTCILNVPGAGFEFDCSEAVSNKIDYGKTLKSGSTANLFHIGFEEVYANANQSYSYINMDVSFTRADNTASCPGTLLQQTCKLRPATIGYPVTIDGGANQIMLGIDEHAYIFYDEPIFTSYNRSIKQQDGYTVLGYQDVHETNNTNAVEDSRLGGIVQAMNQFLAGDANMTRILDKHNSTKYEIQQTGMAQLYLTEAMADERDCGYWYLDPMFTDSPDSIPDLVNQINQIMFLIATDGSLEDPDDQDKKNNMPDAFNGTAYIDNVHYATNYAYMWGGFVSTMVCILCVLPVYWGFWQLGRPVTLGPFEIAAAFRSPMVTGGGTVEEVIKKRGDQKVQFGHIVSGDAAGQLGIAEAQYVTRAHPSIGSARQEIDEAVAGILHTRTR